MERKQRLQASTAGILAGILLGLFFKVVEALSGLRVYTLLLNIDYIPVLKSYSFPETIEFFFHLIISVAVSLFLLAFFQKKDIAANQIIWNTVLFALLIGVLLYPTTIFSSRTPGITSLPAVLYWLAGHCLYGGVLGLLLQHPLRRSEH